MPGVLAIDPGSRLAGWALGGDDSTAPYGGVWELPGGGAEFDRTLGKIGAAVDGLLSYHKPRAVCLEHSLPIVQGHSLRHTNAHTLEVLIGVNNAIRCVVAMHHIKLFNPAPRTVYAFFLGKGAGALSREEVKKATIARNQSLGWDCSGANGRISEDRADANGLWAYGMSKVFPEWNVNLMPLWKNAGDKTEKFEVV